MINDIDVEFFKSILEKQAINNNDFFPKRLAKKNERIDEELYFLPARQLSDEEKKIFNEETFNNLKYFIIHNNIDITFFEKFMAATVVYLSDLNKKLDTDTVISMLEMIMATGFEDVNIDTAMRMFAKDPNILIHLSNTIH